MSNTQYVERGTLTSYSLTGVDVNTPVTSPHLFSSVDSSRIIWYKCRYQGPSLNGTSMYLLRTDVLQSGNTVITPRKISDSFVSTIQHAALQSDLSVVSE